jgi:cytochrome c oxidase cbb3-type subunit 3
MSDFVNNFWNVYVIGLTVASLLFCVFIILSNRAQKKAGPVELHGHVWDETLAEFNNPLPRWWVGLFWITIFFAVGYLILYPGLGTTTGAFGWSSKKQYEDEVKKANILYAPIFDKFAQMDVKAVAADKEAQQMGQRLYLTYCASCHGSDARGAKGFPNLTDGDWLYGGEPDTIKTTIAEGRNGVMPPHAHLGADPVKDVANYVRSLSGLTADSERVQRGKEVFETAGCTACHGADAKGMPALGAPNLTDKVWLYGSSESTIVETINGGRNNQMPAWKDMLGDAKVHLLAAYVYGLSNQAAAQ